MAITLAAGTAGLECASSGPTTLFLNVTYFETERPASALGSGSEDDTRYVVCDLAAGNDVGKLYRGSCSSGRTSIDQI